jgi:hypothetical protein
LPFLENAGDIVINVVLGLLVVVGQRVVVVVVVVVRRRLPSSMTRRRWMVKREVPIAKEARLPSRILLGLAQVRQVSESMA